MISRCYSRLYYFVLMNKNISTILFDVNETLLDLAPLKKSINSALNAQNAAEVWFSELLQYSLVESITGSYNDFSAVAAAVFKMNAQKHEKEFLEEEIQKILSPINKLSAYPDVEPGLKRLKDLGYQLVAFSNGKPSVLKKQLEFAQLEKYFDHILSVEGVKKYKPHPATYHYAIKEADAELKSSMMVAAHAWDIAGAARVDLQTAFIQRKGKFVYSLVPEPDIVVSDIIRLAAELS